MMSTVPVVSAAEHAASAPRASQVQRIHERHLASEMDSLGSQRPSKPKFDPNTRQRIQSYQSLNTASQRSTKSGLLRESSTILKKQMNRSNLPSNGRNYTGMAKTAPVKRKTTKKYANNKENHLQTE